MAIEQHTHTLTYTKNTVKCLSCCIEWMSVTWDRWVYLKLCWYLMLCFHVALFMNMGGKSSKAYLKASCCTALQIFVPRCPFFFGFCTCLSQPLRMNDQHCTAGNFYSFHENYKRNLRTGVTLIYSPNVCGKFRWFILSNMVQGTHSIHVKQGWLPLSYKNRSQDHKKICLTYKRP